MAEVSFLAVSLVTPQDKQVHKVQMHSEDRLSFFPHNTVCSVFFYICFEQDCIVGLTTQLLLDFQSDVVGEQIQRWRSKNISPLYIVGHPAPTRRGDVHLRGREGTERHCPSHRSRFLPPARLLPSLVLTKASSGLPPVFTWDFGKPVA